MSSYEPDAKDAQLFARHKAARKVIKDTRKPVAEAAERAIRAGATNQELASLTGLTPETFRVLAEKIGVDNRAKAPTVGAEAEARRAQTAPELDRRPFPPAGPLLGMAPPPPELELSEMVIRQSTRAARVLVKQAEREHPDWAREALAEFAEVEPRWYSHALLQSAINAGYAEIPE
jgi:hypothetical protein